MSLNQRSNIVRELRNIRPRVRHREMVYPETSSTRPRGHYRANLNETVVRYFEAANSSTRGGYQNPSVVRYFDSLTDGTSSGFHSSRYSAYCEPNCTTDVEVLFVYRQASLQDKLQYSRDNSHRTLLNMFDWDALKIPVGNELKPVKCEQLSDDEADTANERVQSKPSPVAVVKPRMKVLIIPTQSAVGNNVEYVVNQSDFQTIKEH